MNNIAICQNMGQLVNWKLEFFRSIFIKKYLPIV